MSNDEDQFHPLDAFEVFEAVHELATTTARLLPPTLTTAQALLDWVTSDPKRTQWQKNNEAAAIRWLGRIDSTPLAAVPLDARYLVDDRIKKIRQNKELTKLRRSNIVTLLNQVLIRAGILAVGARRGGAITHQWSLLLELLPRQDDRNTMGSFARFCSQHDVEPTDVTLATWREFADETLHCSTFKTPRATLQKVLRTSNASRLTVSGWPLPEFPALINPRTYSIDRASLPSSFWEDVEGYIKASGTPPKNIFDKDAAKQLRPDTLGRYRDVLWRTASSQVHAGRNAAEITDLAALIDVPWLKQGMTWLHARAGGKFLKDHLNCAATWISVAKHYLHLPKEVTRTLREDIFDQIAEGLGTVGFSDKNMAKLDQFADPDIVRRFLDLPFTIMIATRKKQMLTAKDATEMMAAVAIELLLTTMVRRKNLTDLDLSRHFWPAAPAKGGKWSIAINPDEVKNKQPLRFGMAPSTVRLLQYYLTKCRPLLVKAPTGLLFLRTDGTPKGAVMMGDLVKRTIRRHLDLDVNVHLFRHIGTMLYLDTHPGNFGVPKAMLGHTSDLTTQRFYARLEATKAIQHFTAAVLGERNKRLSKLSIA